MKNEDHGSAVTQTPRLIPNAECGGDRLVDTPESKSIFKGGTEYWRRIGCRSREGQMSAMGARDFMSNCSSALQYKPVQRSVIKPP